MTTRAINGETLQITSNLTFVNNVAVHTGISDYDLVFLEVVSKPVKTRYPYVSFV